MSKKVESEVETEIPIINFPDHKKLTFNRKLLEDFIIYIKEFADKNLKEDSAVMDDFLSMLKDEEGLDD